MLEMKKFTEGRPQDIDYRKMMPFYAHVAKTAALQKKRIGGDFVISMACTSRMLRDYIRTVVPECIFVTLTLTAQAQRKRIAARHGEGEDFEAVNQLFTMMLNLYELPGQDELNTYNVLVSDEMSPADVMRKVLDVLAKNSK